MEGRYWGGGLLYCYFDMLFVNKNLFIHLSLVSCRFAKLCTYKMYNSSGHFDEVLAFISLKFMSLLSCLQNC